jgi:hypothetical protein
LGGFWHREISVEEVQPGDWVEFNRQGYRIRRVQGVHVGRKHRYIRFRPGKVPVFKNRTLKFEEVRRVWRKGRDGCSESSG